MKHRERPPEIGMQQHREAFHRLQDKITEEAQKARDKAISYRGFKVGCAVMSWKPELEENYLIRVSGNNTPKKGRWKGKNKRCAERRALEATLNENPTTIVAITSVSKESSTEDRPVAHDVLHPCLECRQLLRALRTDGFVNDETIMYCVNDLGEDTSDITDPPSELVIAGEEMTLKHLLNLYKDDINEVAA